MSSYVVDDKTIHNIANLFAPAYSPCEWLDAIGYKLLKLNIRATADRYRDSEPDFTQAIEYRYTPKAPTTVQKLKSLQCWLYQCSEGEQFESDPLYVQGRKIERELMQSIISELPAYAAATWG